jgi:hypothetical protein
MKTQTLPSWRTDSAVINTRRAIADLDAARPKLADRADLARRQFEKVRAAAERVDTLALIGKASVSDAEKAATDAQAHRVATAQAEHDLEQADARRAALEEQLPAVITDAKARVGRELIALLFAEAKALNQAVTDFKARQAAITHIGDHIDNDYSGPPTVAGHARLVDFPAPVTSGAPILAVANGLRHELHEGRIASWRQTCRDNGLTV